MALVLKDRVKETTTTTGTGTYTLAGAVGGFEAFSQIGDGNTTYYACTDGTDFEVGVGTYTASGTTLARTTILQSSNSDNAVSWGSGTRTIFCTQPAEKAVFIDDNNDVLISPDTDNFAKIGRALVGHSYYNDYAAFRHVDAAASTGYALLQSANAATILNGASISLRINSSQSASIYSGGIYINSGRVILFEGSSSDAYETTLTVIDPTADRTISLPNATGTVVLEDSSGDVSVTNDLTVSGDLFVNGGTIRSEDGTLDFGNFSGDDWGQISFQSSDTNGFDAQFNNSVRFSNEQGATEQHMLLLDTAANNSADLWGISVNNTPIVSITGQSKIVLHEADGGSNTTTISPTSPTADRTITLPDETGTVLLLDSNGDVTFTGDSYNVVWDKSANALEFADQASARFGASNDLVIRHKSTWPFSEIANANASGLLIRSDSTKIVSYDVEASQTTMADFTAGGSVDLYYNNSKKLETASGGITVTGEVAATSLDISGDVDVDGTLEADAITVNGTALNTVIADEATALAIALG